MSNDNKKTDKIVEKIDWTKVWSKKYPILGSYQEMDGINTYGNRISELYEDFKDEFELNDEDTILILKDILYQKYKSSNKKK